MATPVVRRMALLDPELDGKLMAVVRAEGGTITDHIRRAIADYCAARKGTKR